MTDLTGHPDHAMAARQQLLDTATAGFLAVGPVPPKLLVPGTETLRIPVQAPGDWLDGPVVEVAVHRRGSGPAALLVHGWRSQAADLGALADLLVDAGFTVWMPDLPAHGQSRGAHLGIPLGAEALLAVQAQAGPFAVALGHSYGGACLVHALAQGLRTSRAVLLAPPTHYGHFARHAAQQAGLPADLLPAWLQHLGRITGADPDSIVMRRQVAQLHMPALLVHGRDDTVAPFAAVEAVAAAWPSATWMPMDGLGHFRILVEPQVLAAVRSFALGAAAP